MAYDEKLDDRIRSVTAEWNLTRKKMFGGTGYLLNGNMLAGAHRDYLVVRLGPEDGDAALDEPFVKPFDMTGRPMKGWIMVEPGGVEGESLDRWLSLARAFAGSLPPK